jgi:hypothetical protein
MIVDGQLFFEVLTGQAITVTANSTNVLDLGVGRDLGGGAPFAPILIASCITAFASSTASATLTIAVQGAPDNGSGSPGGYQTIQTTPAVPLGQLLIGMRPLKMTLASVSEFPAAPVTTTGTTTSASASLTVASAAGLLAGMNVYGNLNIPPGVTVASISGTTVTLSSGTGVTAGSSVTTSFGGPMPRPRFLRLAYTCSATMTAGSLWAGIVLDDDLPALYAPGFSFPTGT